MSQLRVLEDVRIARPCPTRWAEMEGDDRVRFCTACRKNVYNLSAMTRDDATRLIQEREGDLCARLYRRQDGTVLTSDCPVGVRAYTLRVVQKVAAAAALALLAFGGRFLTTHSRPEVRSVPPSQETPHAVPAKAYEPHPRAARDAGIARIYRRLKANGLPHVERGFQTIEVGAGLGGGAGARPALAWRQRRRDLLWSRRAGRTPIQTMVSAQRKPCRPGRVAPPPTVQTRPYPDR